MVVINKRSFVLLLVLLIFSLNILIIISQEINSEPKIITSKQLLDKYTTSKDFIVESINGDTIFAKYIDENGNENYFNLKDPTISEENQNSYIIQFQSPSIIEKDIELEKTAKDNKNRIESMNRANPLKYIYPIFLTSEEDIPLLIEEHKNKLKNEKETSLKKIADNLGKKGSVKLTGNQIVEPNEIEIIEEYSNVVNGVALKISAEEANKLRDIKEIKKIHEDTKVYANLMDSVPLIKGDYSWTLGYNGSGMKIAIIDTGINYTHPDLGGCIGINCKVIGGYDFVNYDTNPMDDHGHGTHCAGIAAGSGVLKGVAPGAKLYSYKVLNSAGSGSSSAIIAGIERAVDPNNDGNLSDKVDVISMSLGGSGNPDDLMSQAVDNAVNSGVIAVVAAGNSGPSNNTINSPGTSREAITVGAVDKTKILASFSSRGPVVWAGGTINKPDVVAPGVSICAAEHDNAWSDKKCLDNNHVAISGTSMATPHVAGMAALVKQKHPDWSAQDIKNVIMKTADNLGYSQNFQGKGLVNIKRAIDSSVRPNIALISTIGEISGSNINIIGSANGDSFDNYTLYYRENVAGSINKIICTSKNKVDDGILCNFNIDNILQKDLILELIVSGIDNTIDSATSNVVIINTKITSPKNLYEISDIYERVPIPAWKNTNIIGNSYLVNFDHYTLTLCDSAGLCYPNALTISNNGNIAVNSGTLGIIIGSSITKSDYYNLTLTTFSTNGNKISYTSYIYIDKDLHKNSPADKIYTPYWSVDQPNIADLNNDGKKEIVSVSGYSTDLKLRVFDDEFNYLNGFPKYIWSTSSSKGVAIGDINNDGFNELVMIDKGYLIIINKDGSYYLSPKKFTNQSTTQVPVLSDINNDKNLEIIIGDEYVTNYSSSKAKIYVLDKNGNNLPGFPKQLNDVPGYTYSNGLWESPAVGDVDNDGYKEIFAVGVATNSNYERNTRILGFNYQGQELSGWPKEYVGSDQLSARSITLADIDNDKQLEIITTSGDIYSTSKLHVLKSNGNYVSNYPVSTTGCKSYSGGSTIYQCKLNDKPVVGDINNDGNLEIVYQIGQIDGAAVMGVNCIAAHYSNGSMIKGFPVCSKSGILDTGFSGIPTIANIDTDPEQEIIVVPNGVWYKAGKLIELTAINHDGTFVLGYPKGVSRIGVIDHIPISDVDNDKNNEVVFGALDGGPTYIFDSIGSSGYDSWPFLGHDKEFTSTYPMTQSNQFTPLSFSNNLRLQNIDEYDINNELNLIDIISIEDNLLYQSTINQNLEILKFKENFNENSSNKENPSVIKINNISYVSYVDSIDGNKEIYFAKKDGSNNIIKRITLSNTDTTNPQLIKFSNSLGLFYIENNQNTKNIIYQKLDYSGNQISISNPITGENYDSFSYNDQVYVIIKESSQIKIILLNDQGNILLQKQTNIIGNNFKINVNNGLIGITYIDSTNKPHFASLSNDLRIEKDIILSQNIANELIIKEFREGFILFFNENNKIYYSIVDKDINPVLEKRLIFTSNIPTKIKALTNGDYVSIFYNDESSYLNYLTNKPLETVKPILLSNEIIETTPYSIKMRIKTNEPTRLKFNTINPIANVILNDNLTYLHEILIDGLNTTTKYDYQINLTDASKNSIIYQGNNSFRTRTTSKIPALPTTISGTVENTDGKRLEDIEVTAIWTDVDNNNYTSKTKSFNLNEARALGDERLVGSFRFNQGSIKAKPGSKIEVLNPEDINEPNSFVSANPGGRVVTINKPILFQGGITEIYIYSPTEGGSYYDTLINNIYLNFSTNKILKKAEYVLNTNSPIDITGKENTLNKLNPVLGTNTLKINVVDLTNIQQFRTISFFINKTPDTTPPNLTSWFYSFLNNTSFKLHGTFYDLNSPLMDYCYICYTKDGVCDSEWVKTDIYYWDDSTHKRGSCMRELPKNLFNNGDVVTFNFRISDTSNNQYTGTPQTLIMDRVAPAEVSGLKISLVPNQNWLNVTWNPNQDSDFYYYKNYLYDSDGNQIGGGWKGYFRNEPGFLYYNLEYGKNYTFRITVIDKAMNENNGVNASKVLESTNPPIVTIISPKQGEYYNNKKVDLIYGVDKPANCRYNLNQVIYPATSPIKIEANEGMNNIFVSCNDSLGFVGVSSNVTFNIDTIAPNKVANVTFNQEAFTKNLNIAWVISVGTSEYLIYRETTTFNSIDGKTPVATTSQTSYKDQELNENVKYYYAIIPKDSVGNLNVNFDIYTYTLHEIEAPVITIVNPEQNKVYDSLTIPFSYTTNEPVKNCKYSVDGESEIDASNKSSLTLIEGYHSIKISCLDIYDNQGYSDLVQFFIDLGAPSQIKGLSVTSKTLGLGLELIWEKSSENDFKEYKIYRSTNDFSNVANMNPIKITTINSFTDINIEDGVRYYYAVTAIDISGSENDSVKTVSGTSTYQEPLLITITEPKDNDIFSEKIVDVIYESNRRVESCEYFLDGTTGSGTSGELNERPGESWSVKVPTNLTWLGVDEPILTDLENDGSNEIVFSVRDGNLGGFSYIYVYNPDGTLKSNYPIKFNGTVYEEIDVSNVNNEGNKEFIILYNNFNTVLRNYTHYIGVYDINGNALNNWPYKLNGTPISANVFDFDNDGYDEIITSFSNYSGNYIIALNHDGTVVPGWPIKKSCSPHFSHADINNDGYEEIVTECERTDNRTFDSYTAINVLDRFGNNINGFPANSIEMLNKKSPIIADINKDNKYEILTISYKNKIQIFDNLGNSIQIFDNVVHPNVPSELAVGDIDSDSELEILATTHYYQECGGCTLHGYLYSWELNGSYSTGWPQYSQFFLTDQPVAIGDINGDNKQEVIFLTGYNRTISTGYFRIYSGNGELLKSSLFDNVRPTGTVNLGDIDNDGIVEIFYLTTNNYLSGKSDVYLNVHDFGGAYNPENLDWPTYFHDYERTGTYSKGNIGGNEICYKAGDEDNNGLADCLDSSCEGEICNSDKTKECIAGVCQYREGIPLDGSVIANDGINNLFLICKDSKDIYGVSNNVQFIIESDKNAPEPINNLLVETVENKNSLLLSWDKSTADDFNNYNIYRSENSFDKVNDNKSIDIESYGSAKLSENRRDHASSLLNDGRVLVVGGYWSSALFGQATLFTTDLITPALNNQDSSTGIRGPNLRYERRWPKATTLNDGRVLVTGGQKDASYISIAEIYNPATNSFSSINTSGCASTIGRRAHTSTLLTDGNILIAGGYSSSSITKTAEIFNPITNCFSRVGDLKETKAVHADTLLSDGKVLITGGNNRRAELYDPNNKTFSYTIGNMSFARSGHSAVLLNSGEVLITGGQFLNSAEIYNPITGLFRNTTGIMTSARYGAASYLMEDGRVMIFGGLSDYNVELNTVEIYDPTTDSFTQSDILMQYNRAYSSSVQLNNKKIFISGGYAAGVDLSEIYGYSSGNNVDLIQSINNINTNEYEDSGLNPGKNYHYAITAVDTNGNENNNVSSESGIVFNISSLEINITNPEADKTYSFNNFIINYTSNRNGLSCNYELNGEIYNIEDEINAVEGINNLTLLCSDNVGNNEKDNVIFYVDTIEPNQVTNLVAMQYPNQNSVRLIWDSYNNSELLNYNIYRSESDFSDISSLTPIAKISNNTFDDINLQLKTYYYAITIVDKAGNMNSNVNSVNVEVKDSDNFTPSVIVNDLGSKINGVVMIIANVSDNKGLKESCQVCISSDSKCDSEWISASNNFSNGALNGYCSFIWNTESYSKINYTYAIKVQDNFGNTGYSLNKTTSVIDIPLNLTCSDGTLNNTCSLTKPKFCSNKTLIDKCGLCGCNNGTICLANGSCAIIPKCSDGTLNNTCSKTKPLFCTNGNLTNNCKTCGCDSGLICNNITNKCDSPQLNTPKCSDGTPFESCSITKPKYCSNGSLINKCLTCGCDSGYYCENQTGNCLENPKPKYKLILYTGWNLISIPKNPTITDLSTVLSEISGKYEAVFYYDTISKNWMVYRENQTLFDQSNTLSQIEIGKAYWIDMKENAEVTIDGSDINSYATTLVQGWNLIGYPYQIEKPLNESLASLLNNYDIIYSYDNQNKLWFYYSPFDNLFNENKLSKMEAGKGYWIYVYEQGTWRF
ncbi:MAG: S8 family serine peptidase [Candidatus Pacearchaeota archaeon]|jgi:subtilisin family serine protease